jgi:hypothetical protein
MALSYALSYIENNQLAKITNYSEFLEKHPPTHEAEIISNTSWSCAHGVERWKSDCGCNSGRVGWNQQWRQPLRNALDFLRDDIAEPFEKLGKELVHDPWLVRDEYIDIVSNRSDRNIDSFLARHQTHELSEAEEIDLLSLLEMQRHALLMYTSCGWFFDELSGIETVQVIQYAARTIQLAQRLFGDHREEKFIELLGYAPSNLHEHQNGAEIYRKFVKPARVDLLGVGAHYAIASLFRGFDPHSHIYAYEVDLSDSRRWQAGRLQIGVGRAVVRSRITRHSEDVTFDVLHLGDNNLIAGVRRFQGDEAYKALVQDAESAFLRSDIVDAVRALDRHFEQTCYSLKSLFKDEQRRVVSTLLTSVVDEAEGMYRQIHDNHASQMRFLSEIHMPFPQVLSVTSDFVMNAAIRRAFEEDPLDLGRISTLLDTVRRENITLDAAGLSYSLSGRVNSLMQAFAAMPADLPTLERTNEIFALVNSLPFDLNLWKVQNLFYELKQTLYPRMCEGNDAESRLWLRKFADLGGKLGIAVEVPAPCEPELVAA